MEGSALIGDLSIESVQSGPCVAHLGRIRAGSGLTVCAYSLVLLAHGLELKEESEAFGSGAPQPACGFANMALVSW